MGPKVRAALVQPLLAALACSGPYAWSSVQQAMNRSLPVGSSVVRVNAVLDSLGFLHTPLNPRDSTIKASKREPHAGDRLVFSTLQVVFKFDGNDRLVKDSSYEVFTGP